MAKKTALTEAKIVSLFMNHVCEHGKNPVSVHSLMQQNGYSEEEFYKYFGSFEHLEKEIYSLFFHNTMSVLSKNPDYASFSNKEKVLSFYFTFFEMLTANRSYVKLSLNTDLSHCVHQLSGLRIHFKQYIKELNISAETMFEKVNLGQFKNTTIEELAWIQFLAILKFYLDDESASFEKTDVFIEKSLNASFELMNIKPMENIMEWFKFVFKEKIKQY